MNDVLQEDPEDLVLRDYPDLLDLPVVMEFPECQADLVDLGGQAGQALLEVQAVPGLLDLQAPPAIRVCRHVDVYDVCVLLISVFVIGLHLVSCYTYQLCAFVLALSPSATPSVFYDPGGLVA